MNSISKVFAHPRTMFWSCAIWLCVVLAISGCGDGGAQQKLLDDARTSVERGLETWKRGEAPASLLSGPQAIEFFDDDWNQLVTLVEYAVQQTYVEADGKPRCAVDLLLKAGEQPPAQIRVTYEMANKNDRLVIARDPMS